MRALAILFLTACATTPAQAQTRLQTPPKVHVPPFPVTDLVRVGSNGVLAIDQASAQAQVRTDAGDWLPVVKLRFEEVTDVASQNSDVLIAGFNSGAVYAALFDSRLSTRRRWKLDNTSYVDLGVAGPRQMTTESTRALLPDGALGPAKPLSNSKDPRKRRGRPTLLETPAFAIVCLPKDERMSVDAPASCERATAPAWSISGNFESPFLCGSWLITLDERGKRVEARAYAVETGRLVAAHAFATAPTLTCVDDRQVLAAGPTLTLFALPTFKRVWSAPIATKASSKPSFVPNVVVTPDGVTYRVQGSNEIATVALPRPPR
jgi:hypothetical protein